MPFFKGYYDHLDTQSVSKTYPAVDGVKMKACTVVGSAQVFVIGLQGECQVFRDIYF